MAPHPRNSILIVRLSAIGDVVMASPLIAALRAAYPNAHLAWLVQPEAAPLLEANPQLDEVIVWPRAEWRRLWRARRWSALLGAVGALRRDLRARRFDLALDVQGLLKSGLLTWLSGARERIGLGSREGSRWLMTSVVARPRGDQRIASEYRALAAQLGLDTADFAMALPVTAADEARARALVAAAGARGAYAVLCPFTTRPQKHWVAESWRILARALATEFGLRALVLGGPGDEAAAAQLAAGADAASLAGKTTLREAAAVIRGARLLIGVDTGLTHMGIACDTPSVILFGSTRPYLDTGRAHTAILYRDLPCAPCKRRPTCGGDFTCMRAIAVGEVLERAARLLGAEHP